MVEGALVGETNCNTGGADVALMVFVGAGGGATTGPAAAFFLNSSSNLRPLAPT